MTVDVVEQNYKMEQSYNLELALWSLLEQNAASLRAEGARDAMVSVVQRDAVAQILAEVCAATGGNEDEAIKVFSEFYLHIRANPSLSIRHLGEPSLEDLLEADLPADSAPPVNPFGDRAAETRPTETGIEERAVVLRK